MLKIEYTPKALEDLQNINDYIETNWGGETARKILKKITFTINRLEHYPLSRIELAKLIGVHTDYRYIFLEKNYVFYRLAPNKVQIIRVLNEHQDFMNMFGLDSVSNTSDGDDHQ